MKYNQKITALWTAAMLAASLTYPALAVSPQIAQPRASASAQSTQSTAETTKKLLTIQDAIKSAVNANLNLKKYELTRESLLKSIDANYTRDRSIFDMRNYQESLLPAPGTPGYKAAKTQMEAEFNKAMAASDVVMAQLVSQRGTVDMSTVMEREGVGITINRLFTSIMQQEKNIDILNQKIAQDTKNMALYEKQFELGKISQSKLDEYALQNKNNTNLLKIEQGKLQNYYNELEKITQISNIQRDYTLEKPLIEYKVIELSEAGQKTQQQRAPDYSLQVITKSADAKVKETTFKNYPYVSSESSYNQLSDERYIAQLDESQAKRDAMFNAQTKYNSLQELQQNIEIAEKNVQKLENQLKDLQSKYDKGMISKNLLDNNVFAVQEAKNSLEGLKIQHYQLRIMYENPYFAGQ